MTYPGAGWDKTRLSRALDDARRFAARQQVPLFVGEFSCVRWAPAGSCPRYIADSLSLFEVERWGWTYHCWRCFHGWDAEVPESADRIQTTGLLPQHRTAESPTLLLLKQAMARQATASKLPRLQNAAKP
jgi:hypothetical protein